MNKKIALSGLSIVAALTLMGGATFAAFSTTATAAGNTFSTTTPTLTISVNGGAFGTSEPGFTVGGLVPGGSTADQNFSLQNINTDPSGDLTIFLKFNDLAGTTLNGNDIKFTVTCGASTVADTYTNWVTIGNSLSLTVPHNSTQACTMSATLNSGSSGDAGQNVHFDAVFTGSVGS